MVVDAYLYRPRQLAAYLWRVTEPLKLVFVWKCWLKGYHNFGVREEPRERCWSCGIKSVGRSW